MKGDVQCNHDITHTIIWPDMHSSCPAQYLQQQLSLETCVAVLTLAHRHNCTDLRAEAVSGPAATPPCVLRHLWRSGARMQSWLVTGSVAAEHPSTVGPSPPPYPPYPRPQQPLPHAHNPAPCLPLPPRCPTCPAD